DRVTLAFPPGAHRADLAWHEPRGLSPLYRTPRVGLGVPSVNASTVVKLPEDRWVLLVGGPRLGPAVLFWGLLPALLLVAAGLSRLDLAPLRFRDWVLLGIGLSQINLVGAGLVAAWLLALGWRRGRGQEVRRTLLFDLLQILLVAWTLTAL